MNVINNVVKMDTNKRYKEVNIEEIKANWPSFAIISPRLKKQSTNRARIKIKQVITTSPPSIKIMLFLT